VGDRGERTDGANERTRDKESDHESADESEGGLGIVKQSATGQERGGATGSAHHESRSRGREPRTREHEASDEEHESHEEFQELSSHVSGFARRVKVREESDAHRERNDPGDLRAS
jgi:hypothetical protein